MPLIFSTPFQQVVSFCNIVPNALYDNKSVAVGPASSRETDAPQAVAFHPSGTKMFIGGVAEAKMFEYNLSVAWDVSTATYSGNSIAVDGGISASVTGTFFKPDGTKFFNTSTAGTSGRVLQFNMSTPWDITTATYSGNSFLVSIDSTPALQGIAFNPDGDTVFVCGGGADKIYQYSLSSAWDLSGTSTFVGAKVITAQSTDVIGMSVNPNGLDLVIGDFSGNIYAYSLATAWDITTASYCSATADLSGNVTQMADLFVKPDFSKLYATSQLSPDSVFQYSL